MGYTLHNLYGVIEKGLPTRFQVFREPSSPAAVASRAACPHADGYSEYPPGFFSGKDRYAVLDDLRSFLHVFRNLYHRDFDSERRMAVQRKAYLAVDHFRQAVERYELFLRSLQRELGT